MSAATPTCIPLHQDSWDGGQGDGNENDIAGGNNHSTVTGVSLVPGEVAEGFSFASDGYITIPQSPALENQAFTWSAWAKPTGPGPVNDTFGSVILNQATNGSFFFQLSWTSSSQRFVFAFGSDKTEVISSQHAFALGTFYLVSGTYDGSIFQLFINGALEGTLAEKKTMVYTSLG